MAHAQVPSYEPPKQTPATAQSPPTTGPSPSSYQPPPIAGMDSTNNRPYTDQQSVPSKPEYLKTPVGILSVFATVHAFIAIIVMVCRGGNWPLDGAFGFYIFIAVMSLLVSAGTLFIGVIQLNKHYPTVPWPVIMVVIFAVMAFFTLLASSLVAARSFAPADGASAVLGFLLFQAYIACLCLSVKEANQYLNTSRQTQGFRRPAHIHVETPPMGSPPSYIESCPPASLPNSNLSNPTYG